MLKALLVVMMLCMPSEATTEHLLSIVSSRGILFSCTVHPTFPESSIRSIFSYDWTSIKDGEIIYTQGSSVGDFFLNAFPKITNRFTLVTGDCDENIPFDVLGKEHYLTFINDSRLLHWFTQNLVLDQSHPKLSPIPIGLDYHTLSDPKSQEEELLSIASLAPPLRHRAFKCYVNFQFLANTRYGKSERIAALKEIPQKLLYIEPKMTPRGEGWRMQSLMAFVVSPAGGGYDCHRTWEALALGCIPIVKSSPIDVVYEGLPVLIVHSWSDITSALLKAHARKYSELISHRSQFPQLSLGYWTSLIQNVTLQALFDNPK